MTGLEFVASIIDNIFSWPVAALLIVLILRRQLAELFRTVESIVLEAGGARVSFNRGLERAREGLAEAKTTPLPATEGGTNGNQGEDVPAEADQYLTNQYIFLLDLAQNNPSFAIEAAWDRLIAEQARRLAHHKGLPPADDTQYQLRELRSRGVINNAIYTSAKLLNRSRLDVAYAKVDPSSGQALEYTQVAWEVARYLNSLLNKDPHQSSLE